MYIDTRQSYNEEIEQQLKRVEQPRRKQLGFAAKVQLGFIPRKASDLSVSTDLDVNVLALVSVPGA